MTASDPHFADEPHALDDIALTPGEGADRPEIVNEKLPDDVLHKYEVHSYRSAAVILAENYKTEFYEIIECLRQIEITTEMIRKPGGNESEIPKIFSRQLRPRGWHETVIRGDLVVRLQWKEAATGPRGGQRVENKERLIERPRYVDGHMIDYVKNRVAFDLEWNSKDQTFDRDLYAFNAFAQCGAIDVAVLVTRSATLNDVFRSVGPALDKDGNIQYDRNRNISQTMAKYGASTTWMGKLLYRLNAGRNGSCPVLAVGIKPGCIVDWSDESAT